MLGSQEKKVHVVPPTFAWQTHRQSTLVIRWTNDYALFERLEVNRPLVESHVETLMHEIADKGFREECPIFVVAQANGKLGLLAGQHRLEASKRLKREVAYLVLDQPTETAIYNVMIDHAATKGWRVVDFLWFFAEIGNENYLRVYNFAQKYDIEPMLSLKILTVGNQDQLGQTRNTATTNEVKRGHLKVSEADVATATQTLESINVIRAFDDGRYAKFADSAPFISALCDLVSHPKYDDRQMVRKLEAQPLKLAKCLSIREYLIVLQNIYNWKTQPQNRLILVEETKTTKH